MRDRIMHGCLWAVSLTGLHRLAAPRLRGLGAVLMLHHVRPRSARDFAPNRKLEITPEFLDTVLTRLRALRYRLLSLDEVLAELRGGPAGGGSPFAVLTFDDGYRDNLVHALPVLEKHGAPFTAYITSGFADRTARLWWVELEEAIRRADRIDGRAGGETFSLQTRTSAEKASAFATIAQALRRGDEDQLLADVADIARVQGVDGRALVEDLCMDWREIARMAEHPLATIGAHSVTHRRLARLDPTALRMELTAARARIEERIGRPVLHLAYPYGDAGAVGQREFAAAASDYASAVTARLGVIRANAEDHLTSLPRVSVDGVRQSVRCLDVLMSGLPSAMRDLRAVA